MLYSGLLFTDHFVVFELVLLLVPLGSLGQINCVFDVVRSVVLRWPVVGGLAQTLDINSNMFIVRQNGVCRHLPGSDRVSCRP